MWQGVCLHVIVAYDNTIDPWVGQYSHVELVQFPVTAREGGSQRMVVSSEQELIHMLRHMGMCCPNGLPFHQKSLDMGPILV